MNGDDGREDAFRDFRDSPDTLRVYKGDRLIFASTRERLFPLVEYIDTCAPYESDVTVFDRVTGKAAALLLTRISCREIHSELGSALGAEALDRSGIRHRFTRTVPYIENSRRDGMCHHMFGLRKTIRVGITGREAAAGMEPAGRIQRWRDRATRLQVELPALYLAYGHPGVPWYAKVFAACVVGYAFSPVDLIPDHYSLAGITVENSRSDMRARPYAQSAVERWCSAPQPPAKAQQRHGKGILGL